MSELKVGVTIGSWTVSGEPFSKEQSGKKTWFVPVTCGCGTQTEVRRYALGRTSHSCKSCAKTTHGTSNKKPSSYVVWQSMKQRCYDKNHSAYPNYGGRGITVCPEWKDDYARFVSDMGEPPEGTTIDRIDNDAGYCLTNCRWVDRRVQNSNTRRNILVSLNGEKITIAEAARRTGIKASTIYFRYKNSLPLFS